MENPAILWARLQGQAQGNSWRANKKGQTKCRCYGIWLTKLGAIFFGELRLANSRDWDNWQCAEIIFTPFFAGYGKFGKYICRIYETINFASNLTYQRVGRHACEYNDFLVALLVSCLLAWASRMNLVSQWDGFTSHGSFPTANTLLFAPVFFIRQ